MEENWLNVENNTDIIDAEVYKSTELLENATYKVMKLTVP